MSVRQYVGARYVPVFADPLQWDSSKTYEPLTVVSNQGNSYTSRQAVPAGIDISNTAYWAQTGNYNAQIEQYRAEVQTFDDRITANETAIDGLETDLQAEETARAAAVQAEATARDAADDALADDIQAEETARIAADNAINTTLQHKRNKYDNGIMLAFGDSLTYGTGAATPTSQNWPTYFGQNTGMTVYNYGIDAIGFVKTNGSNQVFNTEVNTAKNDSRFDNADVKLVVIAGGINDYGYENSVKQAAITCLENIVDSFPNADVYFIPLIAGYYSFIMPHPERAKLVSPFYEAACSVTGVRLINKAWTWMVGLSDYNSGDGTHSNADGYAYMARLIEQAVNGADVTPSRWEQLNLSEGWSHNNRPLVCECNDGIVHIYGQVKNTSGSTLESATTIAVLPAWAQTYYYIGSRSQNGRKLMVYLGTTQLAYYGAVNGLNWANNADDFIDISYPMGM